MKRLFKNDGTITFGYWIGTHWSQTPQSYLEWACRKIPDFDLQLERLKQGLEPMPGIKDGTKALPVAKPPQRVTFTSKSVRPNNLPDKQMPLRTRAKPPIDKHELQKAMEECGSIKEMEKRLGSSDVTIRKYLRLYGLKAAPEPKTAKPDRVYHPTIKLGHGQIRWTKELTDLIDEMRAKDIPWDLIAKHLQFKEGGRKLCARHFNAKRWAGMREFPKACEKPAEKTLWQRIKYFIFGPR